MRTAWCSGVGDAGSAGGRGLFLLGGLIFWDVFYRSTQAITLSLTEEIWVRNLLNVFIAPVRIGEVTMDPSQPTGSPVSSERAGV